VAKQIDVYREWLQIADPERPLSYYQLMKLKQFEDDAEKIRASYRKLNAHVRKYQTGEYGPQSQQLLNELAKAMLCLTDAQRKSDYDASLGRVRTEEGKRPTFEQILLSRKMLTPDQLNRVRGFADAVGLPIRDALLQQKSVAPEAAMQAYAESMGMPYVDLAETGIDVTLVLQIPTSMARNFSCVPVMVDDGQMLVASPNPLNPDMEEHLRHRVGMPVRSVFCTPSGVNAAIEKHYSREALQAAAAAAKGAAKEAPAAAKQPATKPSAADAKAGGKGKAADEAAPDETGAQSAPSGPQGMKRTLMIGWVVFMAVMILYFAYKMFK
jgi:hypothetical protein